MNNADFIQSEIDELDKRIVKITETLKRAKDEKRRLETERTELITLLKNVTKPLEVETIQYVPSTELKTIIQHWIESGRTLKALADEAAVSEKTLKRILQGKTNYTNELIADSIRTTVGMPHFNLTFIKNPPQSQYYEE